MKSKNELHAIERDLYQLFDMVWAKFYAQIKSGKTEDKMTEAEYFVLDQGPKWLQNIGYYRESIEIKKQDFCFEHNQDEPCEICAGKDRKLPPREEFKRMKQDLRDWIEKNGVGLIRTEFYTDSYGSRGVRFIDMTNAGHNHLIIIGWPTVGLADGVNYRPEAILITGEAGEE